MSIRRFIKRSGWLRFVLSVLASFLLLTAKAQCFLDELARDLESSKATQGFKDFITQNSEGMMSYRKLVTYTQIRKDPDVLKATANFLTRHSDYMIQNPGKFDDIISNLASKEVSVRCNTCANGNNKGIPTLDIIIDDMDWALTQFRNKSVNIEGLFREMAAKGGPVNPYKADGGAYMLNVLRTKAAQDPNFIQSIQRFEYRYLDGSNFEADVFLSLNNGTKYLEFKSYTSSSWLSFSKNEQGVKQLTAYIGQTENFEYVVNVSKLSDVSNPLETVQQQIHKVFKDKAAEFYDLNPDFAKKFRLPNGQPVSSKAQFVQATQAAEFWKQINFVKVL